MSISSKAGDPFRRARLRLGALSIPTRRDVVGHAPELTLGLSMAVQLVLVLVLARDGWFAHDSWHYLTRRGTIPGSDVGLFAPWGGHWQTTIVLVYRLLFAIFGLASFVPYLLVALLLHLSVTALMYRVIVAAGAGRGVAMVSAWLVLFYGAGSEVFVTDGPLPLTAALALGLFVLDRALRDDFAPKRRWLLALVLLVSVTCSGVGLVVNLLVAVVAAARRGVLVALAYVWPAAAAFIIWFAVVGRGGGRVHMHGWDLASIPAFVINGLANAVGAPWGVAGAGFTILVVLVAATVFAPNVPVTLRLLAWAGLLSAVAQMSLSSLASLPLGVDAGSQPRYAYLAYVLLTPCIALVLWTIRATALRAAKSADAMLTIPLLIAAVAFVSYGIQGVSQERTQAAFASAVDGTYRTWVMGSIAAVEAHERVLTPHPNVPNSEDVDVRDLTNPVIRNALPPGGRTMQRRVAAESDFFVGVSTDTYDLAAPTGVESQSFNQPLIAGSGCRIYTASSQSASLVIKTGDGAQLVVTSNSSSIATRLVRNRIHSGIHTWGSLAGKPMVVGVTAKDASLAVAFDAGGRYTICL